MIHLPDLLRDLAIILGAAGVVTVLFKWLRQPVVLGYILAGVFVGPHFHLLPSLRDVVGVRVWAEAGVVFLLFGLGLEFSFKKLARVGMPASVTGLFEISLMLLLGTLIGKLLGWSTMDSIFLGGVMSISSTTIIIRALEELKMKKHGFARLVFGVLVVEDLVAILLLVVLSTVGVTRAFQGNELLVSFGKLSFFLVLWFVSGIFLIPSMLRRVRVHLSEETTVIVSLGLCLSMVLFATKVGFSPALGAFMMGSILAETSEAEKIEYVTRPIRDLFAAVFFVSVGMLIDPHVVIQYALPIAVITLSTMIGKFLFVSLGGIVAGRSLRQSIHAGLSLAQIGEFSFIIATLGLTLKVTSEFLYPIAVAVSAITTFIAPYLIRSADGVAKYLEEKMPERLNHFLTQYQLALQRASSQERWKKQVRSVAIHLVLNGVVVIAIFLAMDELIVPIAEDFLMQRSMARVVIAFLALFLSAPFLWAMVVGRDHTDVDSLSSEERFVQKTAIVMQGVRVLTVVALLATLFGRMTNAVFGLAIAAGSLCGIVLLVSRRLEQTYSWFESRFLWNFTARDRDGRAGSDSMPLAPWDAHLIELVVESNSICVGQSLMDLKVRERYGVTVALIQRGRRRITAPTRHDILFPGDRLLVIGTDEQIQKFGPILQERDRWEGVAGDGVAGDGDSLNKGRGTSSSSGANVDYGLVRMDLTASLPFAGKSIRDSGLRELTKGLVVGIERENRRILNPDSTLELMNGDVLWVVGDPLAIEKLKKASR